MRGPRHFIYPLNPDGPYVFKDDGGTEYPTDYDSFLTLLEAGSRDTWGLSTNFLRVKDRDFIWAYFAGSRKAILAVGQVRGSPFWKPDWKRNAIRIDWDRRLTSRLARDPIEYAVFRQRIQIAVTEANAATLTVINQWLDGKYKSPPPDDIGEVEFVERRIKARRGQRKFRDTLMEAYGSRCVITRCSEPEALEAAHIRSVRRKGRHSVRNGLLLRADIHTLFDRGLIVIDDDYTVRVHHEVTAQTYRNLDGTRLTDLEANAVRPTKKKLREHRRTRGWS